MKTTISTTISKTNIYKNITNIIRKTPLELNERLSKKYKSNIYIKREDLQLCRSFKIRGALHKITKLTDQEKTSGIVCASAGNHAQGVALSSKKFNIKSDIFIPLSTPQQKINRIISQSNPDICSLHITGNTFNECLKESEEFTKKNNKTFIHPYNDLDVIEGQGSIAHEIFEDLDKEQKSLDYIIGCIGGGGLISGTSLYINKYRSSSTKIIGVEPSTCPSMKKSIINGEILTVPPLNNFVDGATVSKVGNITFPICKNNIHEVYDISLGKLCETMIELYQEDGIISEPAGALSISALDDISNNIDITNKNIVCILSGGNNDITRYPEILDRALQYQGKKKYYIIEFIQRPGRLKTFVNDILTEGDDIVRFEYIKKTNKDYGNVLVGIELKHSTNKYKIEHNLKNNNFTFIELNESNELYGYMI